MCFLIFEHKWPSMICTFRKETLFAEMSTKPCCRRVVRRIFAKLVSGWGHLRTLFRGRSEGNFDTFSGSFRCVPKGKRNEVQEHTERPFDHILFVVFQRASHAYFDAIFFRKEGYSIPKRQAAAMSFLPGNNILAVIMWR